MIRFLEQAKAVLSTGFKVHVHCWIGKGRTGTLLAGYLMFDEELPADIAIEEVRQMSAGSIQTKRQERFLYSPHFPDHDVDEAPAEPKVIARAHAECYVSESLVISTLSAEDRRSLLLSEEESCAFDDEPSSFEDRNDDTTAFDCPLQLLQASVLLLEEEAEADSTGADTTSTVQCLPLEEEEEQSIAEDDDRKRKEYLYWVESQLTQLSSEQLMAKALSPQPKRIKTEYLVCVFKTTPQCT